ncbi:MAG: carbohydrate-binding module family 20 domain-containing protein [Bacteroidota bacterium]
MQRSYWYLLLFLGLWSCQSSENKIEVRFEVSAPGLESKAPLYLAGNLPQLGSWKPDGLPLRFRDSVWVGHLHLDTTRRLEFKLTKGSWETEALLPDGSVPENYRVLVTQDTTLYFTVEKWKSGESQQAPQGQVTGNLKYHRAFEVPGLPDRDVTVWLPPDYEENQEARYPVIYAHDGQNLFDPKTATFGVDWS